MNKKILIYGVLALAVVFIIATVFLVLTREKVPGLTTPEDKTEEALSEEIISGTNGRLQKITDLAVVRVAVRPASLIIFTSNGEILESDFSGKIVQKLRISSTNLIKVVLANDNSKAIFTEIDENKKISQTFVDLSSFKEFKLLSNVFSPVFSPFGDKIAFHYHDPSGGINNISIANPDGSKMETVFNLSMYDIDLAWPEQNQIYLFNPASYLIKSSLYLLDIAKKQLSATNISSHGLIVGSLGNSLIYSTVNGFGKDLKLYLFDLQKSSEIPVSALPNKCSRPQAEFLICAQPLNIATEVIPDDYYKLKFYSADGFVKINLSDGALTKIADFNDLGQSKIDASELVSNDNYLFFVNRRDSRLYRLEL